jgi:hypothetical protein
MIMFNVSIFVEYVSKTPPPPPARAVEPPPLPELKPPSPPQLPDYGNPVRILESY